MKQVIRFALLTLTVNLLGNCATYTYVDYFTEQRFRSKPHAYDIKILAEEERNKPTVFKKAEAQFTETNTDVMADIAASFQELKELQRQVKKAKSPDGLLDLNTASKERLMSINGIGPVLAERIIAGRPYKTVDGLIEVNGIGRKKLEKIRPYVVVGKVEGRGN